ncbi:MAG TPA: hypothetical protein VFJ46_17795 [Xanthobacteraceae bacterium]|nr:hypothetical protein [Xanthobacteraceae bacterium]
MKRLAIVAALALALPGCAALPAISAASTIASSIGTVGGKVVATGTQAFVVAEYAYNGAATAANEAGKACIEAPSLPCPISAADAGRIREINRAATKLLIDGKAARDDAAKAVAARDLQALVVEIDQLRN